MHFFGFHILRFICLNAVFATVSLAWGCETSSDSIRLDGKILLVDAQVRFDSTFFSNNQSNIRGSSSAKSHPFSKGFLMTQVALGMPEKWNSGSSVDSWANRPSTLISINVGAHHLISKTTERTKNKAVEWVLSLEKLNRLSLDIEELPDSLIGFVRTNSNAAPLQGVIYEQFPIGIETDTVPVALSNRVLWRTSLQVGWMQMWKRHWAWHASLGATVLLKSEDWIGLETPDVGRGYAYSLNRQRAGQLLSILEVGLRRRFTPLPYRGGAFWTAGMHVRLQPQLNSFFWGGIQLRWHWS